MRHMKESPMDAVASGLSFEDFSRKLYFDFRREGTTFALIKSTPNVKIARW